jgi:non-ribosomal peptide synthetase component F
MQGELLETQLNYWMQQLSGVSPLKLPIDHPRSSIRSQRGAVHHFTLGRELSHALQTLSNQHNVTLFMTLLAAFQTLLYRYSGQSDILVGTDSANRNRYELEEIIGFFINLLPLRTNLGGKPSFSALLQRVRRTVLDAYTYQETPFELLVEKLIPDHSLDHMPLIQALFVMQNLPSLGGESGESDSGQNRPDDDEEDAVTFQKNDVERAAKFDMALFMFEQRGSLHGALNYSKDVFEAKTVAVMIARFVTLLQSIVLHPDYPVEKLNFFTDTEWRQQQHAEKFLRPSRRVNELIDLSEMDFG